jgi:TolA-binding protein
MNSSKFKFSYFTIAFFIASTFSCSAFALFSDDEARKAILDLRVQVTAGQNAQIEFQNQIEELSQENAKLRGRTDLLEKQIEELTAQQKSFYQDLNSRLKTFEPQTLEIEGIQGRVEPGEK